jgi:hypothetical protein
MGWIPAVSLLLTLGRSISILPSTALGAEVPTHRIVSTKDTSFGAVHRFQSHGVSTGTLRA